MKPYYFDGITLPVFMDWDMMGAFIKTKTGNKYVMPGQWIAADGDLYRIILPDEVTNLNLNIMPTEQGGMRQMTKEEIDSFVATKSPPPDRELTFGEKLVGLNFNPSNDDNNE